MHYSLLLITVVQFTFNPSSRENRSHQRDKTGEWHLRAESLAMGEPCDVEGSAKINCKWYLYSLNIRSLCQPNAVSMETVCVTVLEECARFMLFHIHTRTYTCVLPTQSYLYGAYYSRSRCNLYYVYTAMQYIAIFPVAIGRKIACVYFYVRIASAIICRHLATAVISFICM